MSVTAPMGRIQHPPLGFLLLLTSRWLCTQIASLRPCSEILLDVLPPRGDERPLSVLPWGAWGTLFSEALGRTLGGRAPFPPRLDRASRAGLSPALVLPPFLLWAGSLPSPRPAPSPPPARPFQLAAPPVSTPAPAARHRTRCSAGPVAGAPIGKSPGPRPRDGAGPAAAAAALALRPHAPERG